jgi:hypothetical protein
MTSERSNIFESNIRQAQNKYNFQKSYVSDYQTLTEYQNLSLNENNTFNQINNTNPNFIQPEVVKYGYNPLEEVNVETENVKVEEALKSLSIGLYHLNAKIEEKDEMTYGDGLMGTIMDLDRF